MNPKTKKILIFSVSSVAILGLGIFAYSKIRDYYDRRGKIIKKEGSFEVIIDTTNNTGGDVPVEVFDEETQ